MSKSDILQSTEHAFIIESAVHAVRLVVESVVDRSIVRVPVHVIVFELFVLVSCVDLSRIFGADSDAPTGSLTSDLGQVWCRAPFIVLAIQSINVGVYEYASALIVVVALLQACSSTLTTYAVVAFFFLQLHAHSERSNFLRILSLWALLFASFATQIKYARYISVLALELASWATERYMLPWRISEAYKCCNYGWRFVVVVIGVHALDGNAEEERCTSAMRQQSGSHGARACRVRRSCYVRCRVSPLGLLLAYVEGLNLIPLRICRSETDARTFRVVLFGAAHVADLNILHDDCGWKPCDSYESLFAASRFPFRRIILGVLLRFVR